MCVSTGCRDYSPVLSLITTLECWCVVVTTPQCMRRSCNVQPCFLCAVCLNSSCFVRHLSVQACESSYDGRNETMLTVESPEICGRIQWR